MSDLERRIATSLTSDATSADIDALIAETEEAITEAEAAAKAEREHALDLTASPDAKAAREGVQTAEFARDRLQTALPRLETRHAQLSAAEYLADWTRKYEALKPKRDALAAEFAELYPTVEQKLPDVLGRMAEMDAEISRLHGTRPAGVKMHVLGPELVARGMEGFTRDAPSIAATLQLPKFAADARLAWPRRP